MTDYYMEAVRSWQQRDRNSKHFAECCAMVDGTRTAALAADCKCSVDTIEAHRNAWRLYYYFSESEHVRKLWQDASIELWKKAAQIWKRYDLPVEKVIDYLKIASEEGMSRETFAAHVETKENNTPQWLRRLRWVASKLLPSKDDWKTEMPEDKRERYNKAVDWFTNELKEIAEAE